MKGVGYKEKITLEGEERARGGWDAEIVYEVGALSFELIPKFCLRPGIIPIAPIPRFLCIYSVQYLVTRLFSIHIIFPQGLRPDIVHVARFPYNSKAALTAPGVGSNGD
jgi:hypothetical protein